MVIIAAILVAHGIGRAVNSRTPKGGINESMYVEINGTKQCINIYGEDIDNPVLLYLHGGPGSATSDIDYAFTRKWADVYTVVTWDQRNCGKSYDKEQNDIVLTRDILMEDGREMTEFLLDHMGKDKTPYKEIFMMKDTTHGLLESKSDYFSEILHEIAEMEKIR